MAARERLCLFSDLKEASLHVCRSQFPHCWHLGSLPPTIAGIAPVQRAIHPQSAQEVGIWAGRGWRVLRPVRQCVVLRKVTVESSACR